MNTKKITAGDFLALGLYAFAGFGLEILLSLLLPTVLGVKSSDYTTLQHCIHWTLTCVLWGAMTLLLLYLSKHSYGFDIMKNNQAVTARGWVAAAAVAVVAITITTIVREGFKPVTEYDGLAKFVFQNIYYLFEAGLILLTLVFGQKYGEILTKKEKLPWGGLFLAATWGLIHMLVQDFYTGIYAVGMSILYGIIYVALCKNTVYSYVAVAIVFIL